MIEVQVRPFCMYFYIDICIIYEKQSIQYSPFWNINCKHRKDIMFLCAKKFLIQK